MHNQFKSQKFKHLMLAMGPRDLNSAPYSPVHCSSHSMTSFQSSELTELPVVENVQLFAQRVHSAQYAPKGGNKTVEDCFRWLQLTSQDPPIQILMATFLCFSSCGRAQQTNAETRHFAKYCSGFISHSGLKITCEVSHEFETRNIPRQNIPQVPPPVGIKGPLFRAYFPNL